MSSRRDFLTRASLTLAGATLGARHLQALPAPLRSAPIHWLPRSVVRSSHAADTFLPTPTAAEQLRTLASGAVTAAKNAGAAYADVRVGDQQSLSLFLQSGIESGLGVRERAGFGVRVQCDGVWAFAHGTNLTQDALAQAARHAVATARTFGRSLAANAPDFIESPPVTGEWSTPVGVDPFSVPVQHHEALVHAYRSAAARVHRHFESEISMYWSRETRVFASSDGSLTTQRFMRVLPFIRISGESGAGPVRMYVNDFRATSGGYDLFTGTDIQERITAKTAEAVRLSTLPRAPLDVGRYPIVFDGGSLGMLFGQTLGPACDLDRVLGEEADASGTSFLAPVTRWLGASISHPDLHVMGTRALPFESAVRWDDDGVEPHDYMLIREGRLVDYHTTRQNAALLSDWYARQSMPIRSHGCAVAAYPDSTVVVQPPHLNMRPSVRKTSLDDLCSGVSHGVFVTDMMWLPVDQQFTSGTIHDFASNMFEIRNGRVVRRLVGNAVQFATGRLWKSLSGIGDSSTLFQAKANLHKGQPWAPIIRTVSAPAALFKEADVISTRVRL
jgi:TldD protein